MKKVLVLGAAIVDILVSQADESVFRTGSSPTGGIRMSYGGDALNEAIALRHLGVPVRLETVIGDDEAGKSVLQKMETANLATEGIHIRKGLRTGINVVLIDREGERSFLTDPASSLRQLGMEDIALPFPDDVGIVSLASMFVSPPLGIAEMEAIFRQAKVQGMITCADMTRCKNGETPEVMAPMLQYVDYLLPNESEAMRLTGYADAATAAEALHQAGAGTVIVKCGAKGCYVKTTGRSFWADAVPNIPCIDSTGAGDSFAAGFLSGLARELPPEECLALANQCGAKAIQHVGATTWTETE